MSKELVYAVSKGFYDDYQIERIFESKEDAEKNCEEWNIKAYENELAYLQRRKETNKKISPLHKVFKDFNDFKKKSYDSYYIEEFEFHRKK